MQEALRKAMFHVAWSPDTLPTAQAVDPLFDYLHTHLKALNVALLPQNFQQVLVEVGSILQKTNYLEKTINTEQFITTHTHTTILI